jgi:hypothetical protein
MISNNTISRDFLGDFPILLDGKPVEKITAFLFPKGGNDDPQTLIANAGKSFQGSIVLGMGFTFDDTNESATSLAQMQSLIEKDSRNAERIFPYIGGEEVNSSPTHSHHRYVINFGDLSEEEARKWPDLMAIVEEKVKSQRSQLAGRNPIANKRSEKWWIYGSTAKELYKAIEQCDRVLVIARVGQHGSFTFLPTGMVYSEQLIVIANSSYASFTALQSRIHEIWTRFFGSSMKDDLRYTPSDCFETFPFPENWETDETLESTGKTYYEFRAALMVQNNQGLTTTYNRFHDPDETDPDILKLRELHSEMDSAVLNAYGWQDIDITCEFRLDYEDEDTSTPDSHKKSRKKPWRYRWPEATHDEVLARLLTLNQQRYDDEALMGKSKKSGTKTKPKKPLDKSPKITKQINLIQPETEQLDLL